MTRLSVAGLLIALLIYSCGEKVLPEVYVKSVAQPVINLNGTWFINTHLYAKFWLEQEITDDWKEVQVPGEAMMQGHAIKNDEPFAYKKEIDIPLDYHGKKIYLEFDGVYSYCRVWVNGQFVRDHHGGFTRWRCDITDFVKAGEKAIITLEVTDRADDISYASGYAKHQIGGILRDVKLLALPQNHPVNIKIETHLDEQYQNAELIIAGKLLSQSPSTELNIELQDEFGKHITLNQSSVSCHNQDSFSLVNTVINPKKWDAEHPHLYVLRVSLLENDEVIWSKSQKVGFREVVVNGNTLLVNGKPVKLRGACRHDNHPLLGRVATPEYDLQDVLLAKEANMNFIRTSHYPPSDHFLQLCDQYGIYVEDESAVCFIINYRIKGYEAAVNSHSDPEYTDRYLSQLKEMVNTHRNHPSVIIWSLGNESIYGSNFKKSFDWLQENDPTRPIMFSYPGTAPDSVSLYQILSMHYPPISGDLNQYNKITKGFGTAEMPVIFDEWAHVPCYNNQTVIEDPNIRNFWGQSLDSMWIKTFKADGGLGGAIWGMIDETFMLPEDLNGFRDWWGINDNSILPYQGTNVGYGEWGIVDVWRRKKPEFWNTKKAYSPIRLQDTRVKDYQGEKVEIPILNRFDHTNLNEITVKYIIKSDTSVLNELDLEPHQKGELTIPIKNWEPHEKIEIIFSDQQNALIDRYFIRQVMSPQPIQSTGGNVSLIDKDSVLEVTTTKGKLIFNQRTGLMTGIKQGEKQLKISGPFMVYRTKGERLTYSSNEINTYGGNWNLRTFKFQIQDNHAVVQIVGMENEISVNYELQIFANGEMRTTYRFDHLPQEFVREIGLKYTVEPIFDAISWTREPYWSAYPKGHLSAAAGVVDLYPLSLSQYKNRPTKSWNQDVKSFYYEGTNSGNKRDLTYIAKATKENIYEYALLQNNKQRLTIKGQGDISCRLAADHNNLELYVNNAVDYIDLNWGNYQRNIMLTGSFSGESTMVFDLNP